MHIMNLLLVPLRPLRHRFKFDHPGLAPAPTPLLHGLHRWHLVARPKDHAAAAEVLLNGGEGGALGLVRTG